MVSIPCVSYLVVMFQTNERIDLIHGMNNHAVKISLGLLFFTMPQQPPVCQGLLIVEASQSHPDTRNSIGLLWTSDQSDAETST